VKLVLRSFVLGRPDCLRRQASNLALVVAAAQKYCFLVRAISQQESSSRSVWESTRRKL